MKKTIFIIFLIIGILYFVLSNVTNLRGFQPIPLNKLYSEQDHYEARLEEFGGGISQDVAEQDEIAKLRKNLMSVKIEILLKKYKADLIAIILILVGIVGLLFSKFNLLFKSSSKSRDSVIEDIEVDEDMPREVYVDEWEFNQRIEGGFKTKKEAVEWIKSDPLLKCDYCGSRLRSTMTGKKEAVQLVTFYKKVPEGAQDLRVVLGSFWFANAATELKCPGCERIVKR